MPKSSDSQAQDLLVEIRTEELPPAQLWELADSFPDSLLAALQKEGFAGENSARAQNDNGEKRKLATPRRLAAHLTNINGKIPPQEIVRRGPQVSACKDKDGSPTKALIGFMQSVGATCEKDLTTVTEKGKEHIAWRGKTDKRNLADELAAIVERVLLSLPAPRLMRWGANEFKFIRPVRGVLLLHGGQHISGNVMGIVATKTTKGHPFMSEGDVEIANVISYTDVLKEHKVIVDINERLTLIKKEILSDTEFATGINFHPPETDEEFCEDENPDPALQIEAKSTCATLYGDKDLLTNHVSRELRTNSELNESIPILPSDKGDIGYLCDIWGKYYPRYLDDVFSTLVVETNAVLRETSAMCEWPVVLTGKIDQEFQSLPESCIAECLQKHQRFLLLTIAQYSASMVCVEESNDQNLYEIGEFNLQETAISPEYWLVADNETDRDKTRERYSMVLRARLNDVLYYYEEDKKIPMSVYVEKLKGIVFHQKLGSQYDRIERVYKIAESLEFNMKGVRESAEKHLASLPTQMVSEYPQLQEEMSELYFGANRNSRIIDFYRLEKLVGMFGVGDIPTSSKDPHGLRKDATELAHELCWDSTFTASQFIKAAIDSFGEKISDVSKEVYDFILDRFDFLLSPEYEGELMSFNFSQNVRRAVLSQKPEVFTEAIRKMEAFQMFEDRDEYAVLAAANKRINNIFRKSKVDIADLLSYDSSLGSENAESNLFKELRETQKKVEEHSNSEDPYKFVFTLRDTATLAPAVDAFFDNVLVNHEDEKIRLNRFALLAELRKLLNTVGDLSYLAK